MLLKTKSKRSEVAAPSKTMRFHDIAFAWEGKQLYQPHIMIACFTISLCNMCRLCLLRRRVAKCVQSRAIWVDEWRQDHNKLRAILWVVLSALSYILQPPTFSFALCRCCDIAAAAAIRAAVAPSVTNTPLWSRAWRWRRRRNKKEDVVSRVAELVLTKAFITG